MYLLRKNGQIGANEPRFGLSEVPPEKMPRQPSSARPHVIVQRNDGWYLALDDDDIAVIMAAAAKRRGG